MPSHQKVDYLELPAKNFDTIQSFYEKAFEWSFTDYGPEYRAFTDGKIDGGFYKSDLHSSVQKGSVLVILYALNLEEIKNKIISSGGGVLKDIFLFPGGHRFHFTDPNGNELAVWSDQ